VPLSSMSQNEIIRTAPGTGDLLESTGEGRPLLVCLKNLVERSRYAAVVSTPVSSPASLPIAQSVLI
jgi:hypothetical protein